MKSVVVPRIRSLLSMKNCLMSFTKEMVKLSYEQMRQLSEIGEGGKLAIKNRDGKVLRPTLKKWHQSQTQKETKSTSILGLQKRSPAPMGNPSPICLQVSSLPLRRPVGRP